MTTDQMMSLAVIVLMMAAFIWGRFRYDLVACGALIVAVAASIVPQAKAFSGFGDDIVIIVGSALLVSAGVARSGIMEYAIQRFAPDVSSVRAQLALLVIVVTVLSAFVKNIGALAIMIPIAFQFARRSNVSPSVFLMPMAFGSLLGGLMTLIGTSPNIVVSRVRQEMTGEAFSMFDFTPVGAALAAAGIVFLVLFYWLLPSRTRASASIHEAIDINNYVTEARIVADSAVAGKSLGDLLKLGGSRAVVTSILRSRALHVTPFPDVILREGDILLIEGAPDVLDRMVAQAKLSVTGSRDSAGGKHAAAAVEAVIGENSSLIGGSAQRLALYDRFNVNLLAVSRKGERIQERLGAVTLRMGDVVVLQGNPQTLPEILRELGCLPLAERSILLGSVRRGIVPLAILIAAMAATALGLLPVPLAFFSAAVAMVLFRVIPLREVYGAIDGPILVMLAALIPVSDSLRRTGATDVISAWLAEFAAGLPAAGALTLIMVVAMAVTPFLNNAATVLVVAPIAAGFASSLGYQPEAFLMAVAIGAGCDFLTPIGHQCNTLVMGPGGYKFSDYPRLGLPLSLLVILVAVPMLILVWPM
ncbi:MULTISPECIES: SLC13 family permease [Aminobacter]|uniref:Di/tricarboxylate transporter n=1 Tax=Aminobacter niigataensis TaxID=83265 RepID=A0ABR6L252_9HYPH|nr:MULTISPECIES: SLC13 family permease [Aminobacter]AWC24734.1 transporter, divalent anion:Na+ symporter (DASS) family [Aminobacter sp. MSH1]MBB4650145.1 di/tricarboxylate transporter [Aminobacter niigataensis]CAI2935523.1 Transporter, divalent anion:Na+ symporter (DASS) family [Aminobacter niigataensis]